MRVGTAVVLRSEIEPYLTTNGISWNDLSLQFRRVAVSVPANIAEGFRKRGKAEISLLLTEVSKLLEAYSQNILNSDY